jgi:hypothetical protein
VSARLSKRFIIREGHVSGYMFGNIEYKTTSFEENLDAFFMLKTLIAHQDTTAYVVDKPIARYNFLG